MEEKKNIIEIKGDEKDEGNDDDIISKQKADDAEESKGP